MPSGGRGRGAALAYLGRMSELTRRDRGCWIVHALAPDGTPMRAAIDAINRFVEDRRRGLALFHDHFADRPGGLAVFAVTTEDEREAVRDPGPLAGWHIHAHPLIFAESALRFLYQCDYTMHGYRGRRLAELWEEYGRSEEKGRLDGAGG